VTAVGRRGRDTATVVITVGVGTINVPVFVLKDKPLGIAGEIK
jgi:hypothetical protein